MGKKECPVCGNAVQGRSDKRFFSTTCKSVDQYERRQREEGFFLFVDRQLKTNRKILKLYNRTGYTTLRRSVLESEGFNPRYFTHYWKNRKGDVYLFCYDFGFLSVNRDGVEKYVVVKWQDYMNGA